VFELVTNVVVTLIEQFDDLDLGLIYLALLRKADGVESGGQGHPISVNAISRSVARPFETVRRRCNQLCGLGLAMRVENGMIVPREALNRPEARIILDQLHDLMVRLIEDLREMDCPLPGAAPGRAPSAEAIECAALDVILYCMEFGYPPHPHRGWMTGVIYMTVMVANARSFAYDKTLALRYADADTPPPDAVRTALSAATIARALGLPYATVRRHAEAMIATGELERRSDGYLVSASWMQREESLAAGQSISQQLQRVLRQLGVLGFPFNDPARAYRSGRPALVKFD
jgi:hypothetical protein